MNGYVITETDQEALACFEADGVRHVSALASGEGFVAFEGERPCAGALLLAAEIQDGWWHVVKRIAPNEEETEAFFLLTQGHFYGLTEEFQAATKLTTGNVLVQTDGRDIPGALWGSRATSWVDERVSV